MSKGVRSESALFQESETELSKNSEYNTMVEWDKPKHKLDVALGMFESVYGCEKTNRVVIFLNNMTSRDVEEMRVLHNVDLEALIEIIETKIKQVPNT